MDSGSSAADVADTVAAARARPGQSPPARIRDREERPPVVSRSVVQPGRDHRIGVREFGRRVVGPSAPLSPKRDGLALQAIPPQPLDGFSGPLAREFDHDRAVQDRRGRSPNHREHAWREGGEQAHIVIVTDAPRDDGGTCEWPALKIPRSSDFSSVSHVSASSATSVG